MGAACDHGLFRQALTQIQQISISSIVASPRLKERKRIVILCSNYIAGIGLPCRGDPFIGLSVKAVKAALVNGRKQPADEYCTKLVREI